MHKSKIDQYFKVFEFENQKPTSVIQYVRQLALAHYLMEMKNHFPVTFGQEGIAHNRGIRETVAKVLSEYRTPGYKTLNDTWVWSKEPVASGANYPRHYDSMAREAYPAIYNKLSVANGGQYHKFSVQLLSGDNRHVPMLIGMSLVESAFATLRDVMDVLISFVNQNRQHLTQVPELIEAMPMLLKLRAWFDFNMRYVMYCHPTLVSQVYQMVHTFYTDMRNVFYHTLKDFHYSAFIPGLKQTLAYRPLCDNANLGVDTTRVGYAVSTLVNETLRILNVLATERMTLPKSRSANQQPTVRIESAYGRSRSASFVQIAMDYHVKVLKENAIVGTFFH